MASLIGVDVRLPRRPLRVPFGVPGLLERRTPPVLVAELMGHAGLETTRAYNLPTDADREAAINSLITDR